MKTFSGPFENSPDSLCYNNGSFTISLEQNRHFYLIAGRNDLQIAIVEDQPTERGQLKSILQEYSSVNRLDLGISCFSCAEDLVDGYKPMLYAAIFLDIYMKGMSGIEAARIIRTLDSHVLIVFLTGSPDFMPDAFSLHAFDYISKPADTSKIFRVMDDILQKQNTAASVPRFVFSLNRQDQYLPFSEIAAVSADGNYLEIMDRNQNCYRPRMTFAAAQEQLSEDSRFLLILRGVLVNMDAIIAFDKTFCLLEGNLRFPINLRNSRQLMQIWQNYTFQKIRLEAEQRNPV